MSDQTPPRRTAAQRLQALYVRALLRLLPERTARILRGSIRFDGQDLLALKESEMRDIRG